MFNVNNKKTILKLSKTSFKSSRMRNFFAIIAIILTTVLFTSFITIGGSLISSIEEGVMRQVGGSYHAGLKRLSEDQYNQIKLHENIEDISYSVILGIGENKNLEKRQTEIRYTNDSNNALGMFSMPTTGRLPEKDNEIATDTLVLELLGIPLELGQNVTLEYSVGGEKRINTFELVGFWVGDPIIPASQVWLNRSYVESELSSFVGEYPNDAIGTINANVNFSNDYNIEEKIVKVIIESGYSLDEIDYGINWAYIDSNQSINIFPILGFVFMIALSGYLMISNVFYISVAKDVNFFGLLKTIGTTPSQIRRIIRFQAIRLCVVGIPIGVIIGTFVGAFLVPKVFSVISVDVVNVEIHPIIFIISSIFSIATVLISIVKPSRIAAHISPIEALRSSDNIQRNNKKNTRPFSLMRMAIENILRNKKKTLLVTISLSLGLIILNTTFSLANSFDMDKFLSSMIDSDFVVGHDSNFNSNSFYTDQKTLDRDFFDSLFEQQGIETVSKIHFAEPYGTVDPSLSSVITEANEKLGFTEDRLQAMKDQLNSNKHPLHIYGLDDGSLSRLSILQGELDMEKLKTGQYVIAEPFDSEKNILYYNIGDKVWLPNAEGVEEEYEVLAIADIPYNISIKHWHSITPAFYLPSEVFLSQIENKTPMLITIDVNEQSIQRMEAFLESYSKTIDLNMSYQSKASISAEYENTQRTYQTVGVSLSILIALVGIMNFINTIITSIHARKLELAMMQSIGMTTRQTRIMLMLEGLIIIGFALLVTLTIGSIISFSGLKSIVSQSSVMSFYFTVTPSLICTPVLLLISVLVSHMSQESISKDSIVERLRAIA
ncbi:MAG: FtsX-like permease family protein [Bacillota bacterium]|nr:FtsX-like permease family protein [Bacillota bacterium]